MNLILILTFFVFKIVGVHSKWKYEFGKETCPTSDFPCENIFKLGKINKCNGLVFCYPSLLSNPYLFGYNTKFNNRFAFKEGNNSRICTRFIKKEKVQSPEGIKTVWSGFRLFYNNKKNELEVNLDIVGERETIYLTDITIPDFLHAISSKKGAEPTWAKIKEQSKKDKEFIKVIKEGAKLNEFVGIFALNVDLGIGIKLKSDRDVAYAFLKRRDYPTKCRLVKKTTTVKQTTTTPAAEVFITKIKNITPKIKKTSTLMPFEKFTPFALDTCKFFKNQNFADRYGCKCGSNKELLVNLCCENYHSCIESAKQNNTNCSSLPTNLFYISINTSNYNWEFDKCLKNKNNRCQQEHCECDRYVVNCWSFVPLHDDFDEKGNLKIKKNEEEEIKEELCSIKLVEEAKQSSMVPIINVTKIKRTAFNNVLKLNKLLKSGKYLEPEVQPFLHQLNLFVDKSLKDLKLFDNITYSTLNEIVEKSKIAMEKVEKSKKTMDEKDLKEAEEYFIEYLKIRETAITFGQQHADAKDWLHSIIKIGAKIYAKRKENNKN